MKRRPNLPEAIEARLLYRNAARCCVCRTRGSIIVHHIDGNHSNNDLANLAVVCPGCHDKAHTEHKLSKNLTPERLSAFKKQWEEDVERVLAEGMLPETLHEVARWSYINHDALPSILKSHGISYPEDQLRDFNANGIVTPHGVPRRVVEPDLNPDELITIYDQIPFEYRGWLVDMYSEAIGRLIVASRPVDFRELRTSDQVRALVRPGTLCFIIRGFRFRSEKPRPDRTQIRHVETTFRRFSIKFLIDVRFMFGTSAVTNSFTGHRDAAALVQAKSIGPEEGKTVIHCTPVAMGVGFLNRRTFWPGPGDG